MVFTLLYCLLYLFPFLTEVILSFTDNNLCLVSQLIVEISKNESHVHPYPEFYFPRLQSTSQTFPTGYSHHQCNGVFEGQDNANLRKWMQKSLKPHETIISKSNCVFGVCPLVHENMVSTWNIVDWNFSADAICDLGKHFTTHSDPPSESKVKVNVIVFGGNEHSLILFS